MIISNTHKFLFVATTKTGSTSIQKYLEPYKSEHKITHLDGSYNKHCPLKIIYNKFPYIKNYFKFAIVRNPYDWIVSWYHYRKSNSIPRGNRNPNCTDNISFKQWLIDPESSAYNKTGIGLTMSQMDVIEGNDEITLDFIGKLENLQQDFDTVCDKIGIPRQQLSYKNKSKHNRYTEYYDDETKSIVAERYAREIELFGYKFGG